MKNRFYLLTFATFIFALNACSTATSSTNLTNANSSGGNSIVVVGSNQNANAAEVAPPKTASLPAEVPTFETAADALDLGKKYFDNNDDEKAVNAYEQAVKLEPNSAEAHYRLGLAREIVEKTKGIEAPTEPQAKGGKRKVKVSLKSNGKDRPKTNLKPSEKAFYDAIKICEKNVAKNKKDADSFYYLGSSYNRVNEDEKAQKALSQAVKLQPDNSEFQYELGTVQIKLAKYADAVKALKKSLELDPENYRTQAALDKAQAGDDRVSKAKAALQAKNGGNGRDRNDDDDSPAPTVSRPRKAKKAKSSDDDDVAPPAPSSKKAASSSSPK